jgi:hypothetical protein
MEPDSKSVTPPKVPAVTLSPEIASQTENQCQWFLGENTFCDKIKKNVRCDGNVKRCPF